MSEDMMDEFAKFQAEMAALEGEGAAADDATASKSAAKTEAASAKSVAPAASAAPAPAPRPSAVVGPQFPARSNVGTITRTAERVPAGPSARPQPTTSGTPAAPLVVFDSFGRAVPPPPVGGKPQKVDYKPIGKALARSAGGDRWEDASLAEWPENDHRIFVGDLGNECTDDMLSRAFSKYPSFAKAKVVKDKMNPGKNKGFGFVSFLDLADYALAMKEMNGKFIGNRPVKLRKSSWNERTDEKRKVKGLGSKGKFQPLHKRKHIAIGPSIRK
jgi:hypothetical protein